MLGKGETNRILIAESDMNVSIKGRYFTITTLSGSEITITEEAMDKMAKDIESLLKTEIDNFVKSQKL